MTDTLSSQADTAHLRDYLRPLLRWKWLILALVVATTLGTYAYYAAQDKVYKAATRLLVTGGSSPLDPAGGELSDRTLQDQAILLTSREVAEAVAGRTDLGKPGELAANVTATPRAGTSFIDIEAEWRSAGGAAELANAFAQTFIDLRAESERGAIERRIAAAQRELDRLPVSTNTTVERAELRETIRSLRLSLSTAAGAATQVDPAVPPGGAAGPKPLRNTIVMMFVALIVGTGLAYGLEAINRRITRLDDFPELYRLPILGVMPRARSVDGLEDGKAAIPDEMVEAFRQLRTNMQLMALDQPFKYILVTSAVAGEGKSTVVRNLAIALREAGRRVALVDADLRRPRLAELFGQDGEVGLTTVLTQQHDLDAALRSVAVKAQGLGTLTRMGLAESMNGQGEGGAEVVSLLASGPQPPDPQAVLGAARHREVLHALGATHDVVLIDSPPLLHVSDAAMIAPWVDAVLIVGRLGVVTRDNARRLVDALSAIPDVNPIGVVVNDVPQQEGYGYGYGYGYSH